MTPKELPWLVIKYGEEINESTRPKTKEYISNGVRDIGLPSSRWYLANGLCWYYAYIFKHIFGGEIYSYQNKEGRGHCFVKYNGLFYDAETIEGKKSWKHLQRYLNTVPDKNLVKHRTITGFLSHWKIHQFKESFDKSIYNIQETLRMKR